MDDLPVLLFETPQSWEAWLEKNHQTAAGVKVKIAKKGADQQSITYAEALEVALCFGWIDSRKDKLDDAFWVQRFTPRRRKSPWSAINREKAEALIAQGKMREAGLREVEQAKQDGRWEMAYQPQSRAEIPADFQQALDQNETASAFFATLNSANRYAIIYRVNTAKKPETRQKRIAQFIDMLAQHQKIYG